MRKNTVKWICLPILVCAAMFLVEAACQWNVLRMPSWQRTDTALDAAAFTVSGGEADEWAEDDWAEDAWEDDGEDEAAPEAYLATEEQTLSIPYEGYVEELTLLGGVTDSQRYTVTCALPEGGVYTATSVFLEALGEDSVHIGRQVAGLEITFSMGGATITGAAVHNGLVLNPNRMLLVGLAIACAYLLIAFRQFLGKRQEFAFLAVALAVGLFLSIGLPTNVSLCFDDQIHVGRIFELSQGHDAPPLNGAVLLESMSWSVNENDVYSHRLDTLRDERAFTRQMDELGAQATDGEERELHWQFSDTGYLTQALGMALARWLGLPIHVQLIFARVANMLTYVLLCFLAVKVLRRFKMVMACAALLPAAIYQACSLTYDPTGTALCYLGIALAVDAMMDRRTPLSWARALGMLLCFVVGSLTKIVYIPLILLALLLPRSKFSSNAARIWFKTMVLVLCAAVVLAMMANVAGGGVALQDSRSAEADSNAQMTFLLSHPLTYLGYFFSYLWEHFDVYFLEVNRVSWAYIGSVSGTWSWISLGLMLFVAFTDNPDGCGQRLNWRLRLAMLIIAGLAVGMTFTTMYVAFSAVGAKDFGGVQARYFIPVMPLLLMLLNPEGVRNRMNKTGWTCLFGLTNLAILFSASWQMVYGQFFR